MASDRYVLVDSLRGIAAVSVMLFHLCRDFIELPLLFYGGAGVYVFFVISGFVICHSLINRSVDGRFFALFMLRRSVRLDPTYWFCIGVALVVLWLPSEILGYPADVPSWQAVGLHAVYLQDLVGIAPINIVFWSLCYEIQFYLVFCAILLLARKISQITPKVGLLPVQLCLLSICFISSLLWPLGLSELVVAQGELRGLFLNLWYLFLLGCFSYLAIGNQVAIKVLGIGVLALALFVDESKYVPVFVGLATSLLLLVAGKLKTLTLWLKWGWLQYLGLISYSLYLIHDIIGLYVRDTGLHLASKYLQLDSYWFVAIWCGFSVAVCIVSAILIHRYIEAPSIKWSKKIRY